MEDFIFTPIVIAIGLAIHLLIARNNTVETGRLLTIAFGGHVVASLVQVWLVLYYFPGGGDMLGYFATGLDGSAALHSDLGRFLPEVVAAFFRTDYHLPIDFFGTDSTQSMSAASALLLFLTGDSLYAVTMAVGMCAYVSQYLLYVALREYFPLERHGVLFIGTNLIPSGIFWSSALLKEPLVMVAIGPLVLGLQWLASGRNRARALLLMGTAGTLLAMLKPYVLMALSLSAGIFYLMRRLREQENIQLKPFAIVSAVLLTAAGLIAGSRFLSKGDGEKDSSRMLASQRQAGYEIEGGSNYYLDSGSAEDRSLAQEILLAPLGLATALFRPLVFEARNAVQFANAIEATLLLVWVLQALRRHGIVGAFRRVSESPALLFCLVFTVALGLGTGLASSNLGTLSRYRAPMMPFYFTVVVMLRFGFRPAAEQLLAPALRAAASRAR